MIKNLHAFKIIVAILFSLAGTMQVMAIPAKPGKIQRIQPDGSTLTFELKGDEHCHALYTCDGYMLADDNGALYYAKMVEGKAVSSNVLAHESNSRDSEEKMFVSNLEKIEFSKLYNTPEVQSSRAKAIKKASGDDFPAEGEMRGIVLLVDFKNLKMLEQHDQDSWSKLMNEENTEIYNATGSAADYFKSQSMGVFAPKFDVIGPIEMDKDFEYYGRNDGRGQDLHPQDMVKEACEKAHSDFGVDFSKYDYDGDGYVDFVYLFYAGYGEASGADSNTIWPHSSRISIFGYDLKLDGKVIDSYACSNELYGTFGDTHDGIGAFCHEFSHVLGLPDMYNTKNTSNVQVGTWDIMESGSYNNMSRTPPSYSAYERYYLGWLNLVEIDEPEYGVQLPELTANNFAYRISTKDDNEYFILENHQQRGWDKYQYGTGMLAFHVLYDESLWATNNVNSGLIPHYNMLEADGYAGSQGAPFPGPTGSTYLTDYSKPANMLQWDGSPTDKGLSNIQEIDGVISFDFMHDRYRPVELYDVTDITDHSFTANWEPAPESEGYRVDMTEILPEEENPVIVEEDFASMDEFEYPKSGYDEISGDLDYYTKYPGWTGESLYESGNCVRVGGYGVSGYLASPLFDASSDEKITLALRTQGYPGKSVNVAVELCDEEGTALEAYTYKGNKDLVENVWNFTNLQGARTIKISTTNERVFVHDMRILHGCVAPEDVWTVGPKSWSVFAEADNYCVVDGLRPEHSYFFNVITLAEEELKCSQPSETMYVTTLPGTGVEAIDADSNQDAAYFDLMGRKVDNPSVSGLYIKRQGNKVNKLILK